MDRPGAVSDKGQPKFLGKLCVKISYLLGGKIHRPAKVVPPGEITGAQNQRLVHGQQGLTVTGDAPLVSQGLGEGLTQTDADVLHRVVEVHLRVSLTAYRQVKIPMAGKELQHVVQKAHAGGNFRLAEAVQGQG